MLELPTPLLVQTGAVGVVLLIVIAILRGALVPRQVLDDARADCAARVAEATVREECWRQAYLTAEALAKELAEQQSEGLELARTSTALLRAAATGTAAARGDAA